MRKMGQSDEHGEIAEQLRLANDYWLKTIQPYIQGRKLRWPELDIAQLAHGKLKRAVGEVGEWNASHPNTSITIPDLTAPEYRYPEPLCADDLKPETLAAIGAPILSKSSTEQNVHAAVRTAHDLLLAAEQYIQSLPQRPKDHEEQLKQGIVDAFSEVTFDEIYKTSAEDSGLPLLYKLTKRTDKQDKRPLRLRIDAIRKAVIDFLQRQPNISRKQFEAEQRQNDQLVQSGRMLRVSSKPQTYDEYLASRKSAIQHAKDNSRMPLLELSELRWQRFKDTSRIKRKAAATRQTKRKQRKKGSPGQ